MYRGLPDKTEQVPNLMRALAQVAVEEHWRLDELKKLLRIILIEESIKRTKSPVQTGRDLGVDRNAIKQIKETYQAKI